MRALIFIVLLTLSYLLLSGWPESVPAWLRAGLALIVVMLALAISDASRKRSSTVKLRSMRAPKWLDYMTIGTIFFGVELLILALFTLGPETTEEAHGEVKYWLMSDESASSRAQDAPGALSHSNAGNWLWDDHFSRSHPTDAAKRPPNKPEIFMKVEDSRSQRLLQKNRIYLHTFALDKFDGVTWSIHRPSRLVIEKPDDGSRISMSPVVTSSGEDLPIIEHEITQLFLTDGQNVLTTLHHAIDVEIDTITKVNTDTFTLPPLRSKSASSKDKQLSYTYSARSQPFLLDAILKFDNDIEVGDTQDVFSSKVNNPRLQDKLTGFVSSIDQSAPLIEQLEALKKLMSDQCTYSLTIKNKKKINPLENFLFVEKAGYCEFYASATAMLCRELGIPSRIVFGWSGGRFYESSDLFVFRSKDAHAWAEVYLDGYGWVVFDTTPPVENAVTESEGDEKPPEVGDMFAGDEDGNYELEDEKGFISWTGVLFMMGGFAILLTALLLARRFTQPEQHSIMATHVKDEPKYLQIFQDLSLKSGQPFKPGSTLMQNVQALQERDHEVTGLKGLLDEMLTYHYDTTYRNAPVDKAKESRFSNELKKMVKQLEG